MGRMWKSFAALACFATCAGTAHADGGLSALEQRWLQLSWPAITYAKAQKLPLDIVVQPQPTPGQAPLAMAYVDGRCKLVLSTRDNPEAESTLEKIPAALLTPVVEAMAAHEVGHCWRYVRGAWFTVPAGFIAARDPVAGLDNATRTAWHEMQQTRREEGFADLVALAWTRRQHPAAYAAVHAWLVSFRDDGGPAGNHHDTLAWVRLATDSARLAEADNPFDEAWPLWQQGLAAAR